MKNEGLDKLKNEAVNALVRWGKIGLGLYPCAMQSMPT